MLALESGKRYKRAQASFAQAPQRV